MSKIRIGIDVGHGVDTPGKRCLSNIDPNETREWSLNKKVAEQLIKYLYDYSDSVEIVIINDCFEYGIDSPLSTRIEYFNRKNIDYLISIHHNAGINGGKGGGTVVFYNSSKKERQLQAQYLYNHVTMNTDLIGNRSSKVSFGDYAIIRDTTCPALLLENGFMDSQIDTPIILTKEHARKTAQGILGFILYEFDLETPEVDPETNNVSFKQECTNLVNRLKELIEKM